MYCMRAMPSIVGHGLRHLSNHQKTESFLMLCGFSRGGGGNAGTRWVWVLKLLKHLPFALP